MFKRKVSKLIYSVTSLLGIKESTGYLFKQCYLKLMTNKYTRNTIRYLVIQHKQKCEAHLYLPYLTPAFKSKFQTWIMGSHVCNSNPLGSWSRRIASSRHAQGTKVVQNYSWQPSERMSGMGEAGDIYGLVVEHSAYRMASVIRSAIKYGGKENRRYIQVSKL